MKQVTNAYRDLLAYGKEVCPRFQVTKELLGVRLLFGPTEWFIEYPQLALNKDYVKKEMLWYSVGDKKDLSILEHASIWANCVDNFGEIQSNYGYYFNAQVGYIAKCLKEDRESRRAVININMPEHNYVGAPDVPCTMCFTFVIRGNKLIMMAHMRSQDAVYGLRNDLPAFQLFKLRLADLLNIEPGQLILTVDSFHVYMRHWRTLEEITAFKHEPLNQPGFLRLEDFNAWFDAE